MNKEKERPEEKRERLRQEELKRNPAGSVHGGGLQDLVGGLGWKGTGILILLLLIASLLLAYSILLSSTKGKGDY